MRRIFAKLLCILMILSLFNSCMTIEPDNRSEAVSELKKLSKYSITRLPLENPIGPVYRINAPSNNAALMIAGQTGLEIDFKYFIIIESGSNQNIYGYMYQGIGGVSTETTYSISVAFTNDESYELKYNAYECSTLLDGFTFTTQGGRIASWTLIGMSIGVGSIMMFSSIGMDYDNPNYRNNLYGGIGLMCGSLIFTIPFLW